MVINTRTPTKVPQSSEAAVWAIRARQDADNIRLAGQFLKAGSIDMDVVMVGEGSSGYPDLKVPRSHRMRNAPSKSVLNG